MDETDALIARARDAVEDIVELCRSLLALDAEVERVHRGYMAATFDLLGEAEAQAVLAAAGDRSAYEAIEQVVIRLTDLREAARGELSRYMRDAGYTRDAED